MVGGNMYVSGGIGHIHGLNPYPVPAGRYNVPPYYATISAVINETTAEVEPAYQVQGIGDIQSYYPTAFHTKNGHFTKTGSGQTQQRKVDQKREASFAGECPL